MKLIRFKSGLTLPPISVGCMRIKDMDLPAIQKLMHTALDAGVNFFDHADIYGGGECEEKFSKAMELHDPAKREKLVIQTKCGIIRGGRYDFSKEHILASVEGSLKRLNTDYIDILLLHRPDALCQPEEVAEALHELHRTGKVLHFGVSNHTPLQIELLQRALDVPLEVNQIQMSIAHCPAIAQGMNANTYVENSVDHDGGMLDYCRLKDIRLQAWSPVRDAKYRECFIDSEHYPELNAKMAEIGEKYGLTKEGVAMAWLTRHPAGIQPVTGTTRPERLAACIKGAETEITREEWYELYRAAGNKVL